MSWSSRLKMARRASGSLKGDGQVGESARHSGAVGFAVGEGAAAGPHEQGIDVAVVAAFEFDDLVAPGEAARQAQRGHGGFGAGVDHADFLDAGHPLANEARHFHFQRIWNAETDAVCRRFADGGEDDFRRVAEDGGAPGADVINEFIAVDIPNVGALGALDKERFAAHAAEGAHWGIDSAGDEAFGFGECGCGNGMCHAGHDYLQIEHEKAEKTASIPTGTFLLH